MNTLSVRPASESPIRNPPANAHAAGASCSVRPLKGAEHPNKPRTTAGRVTLNTRTNKPELNRTEPRAPAYMEPWDDVPTCPRCGAVCHSARDYCPECGRKVKRDYSRAPRAEIDMVTGLSRNFGHRIAAWLNQDVCEDRDTYEDLRHSTFHPED